MHTKFLLEILKGRDQFEDPGVNRRIILELILRKKCGKVCTGCVWDQWRVLGNMAMNLWVP
jgi:hypothetical protein